MNSLMKRLKRLLHTAPFTNRIPGSAFAILSIAGILLSAPAAHAACGLTGVGTKNPIRLPMLAEAGNNQDDRAAHEFGFEVSHRCHQANALIEPVGSGCTSCGWPINRQIGQVTISGGGAPLRLQGSDMPTIRPFGSFGDGRVNPHLRAST